MMIDLSVLIAIVLFSFIAYKKQALSKSGGLLASIVGLAIWAGLGFQGLILLGAFFVSSTFWSKYKRGKKSLADEISEKTDQRDGIQVLANGGIPALASLLYMYSDDSVWIFVFALSLAGANSDTWASEIGVLSKQKPILFTTFKRVDPGTSGGISGLGTAAGFFGSAFIGGLAAVLWENLTLEGTLLIICFGFISMLIDTILGITVQRKNQCIVCHKKIEANIHCFKKTTYVSGLPFVNNDAVNISSILFACVIGTFIYIS